MRLLDGLVGLWLALWLLVGAWAAYTVWQLSDLGDTVTTIGQAVTSAGEALQDLSGVPVLGDKPGDVGSQVESAGADIADRGQRVRSQLRQLSLLLGLSIAVMPTTLTLGLYLPLRSARRREVVRLGAAPSRHGDDEASDRAGSSRP